MDLLYDIAIGLTTGLLGYGTSEGKRRLLERRALRHLRAFWLGGAGRFKFVYPIYHGEYGAKFPKNMARIEDIAACQIILEEIQAIGATVILASDDEPDDNEADLILICSPRGNRKSLHVATHYQLPFLYKVFTDKPSEIEREGIRYQSGPIQPGPKTDFALLVRLTDTARRRKIFCLWGLRGAGTLGAAQFLNTPRNLARIHKEVGNQDFAVVIRVIYEDPRQPKSTSVESPFITFHT